MYTVTVKIAAKDTPYVNEDGTIKESAFGHMWYSLAENGVSTGSYGFASSQENLFPFIGKGYITDRDDVAYQSTYYTGQLAISADQYNKLINFANNINIPPYSFYPYYDGLSNSCIDFVWKALEIIGINPNKSEGEIYPTSNADNVDQALYKYLMGNTTGWDESLPDNGNYDAIYGSKNADTLQSKGLEDAMYGGGGDDVLVSSIFSDKLYGGDDFDTYVINSLSGISQTIIDTDGKGLITFGGIDLTGVKTKVKDSDSLYKDNEGFTYEEKDGKLIITKDAESITIENWENKALGIELVDNKDIEVSISDASAMEAQGKMTFTVSLSRAMEDGEKLTINADGKTLIFNAGEQTKTFEHTWNDDSVNEPDEIFYITPTDGGYEGASDNVKVTIANQGKGTIIDDDPVRHDPLALDTNKDGFISTTPLATSTTYFDITNILTCKDFHTNKSLHVRNEIKQK